MGKALDLRTRSRSIVSEAAGKLSPIDFLKAEVHGMSREDVDALAVAYLLGQVKGRNRRSTLTVEREAERPVRVVEPEAEMAYAKAREAARQRMDGSHSAGMAELWASVTEATDRYKSQLRVEWTRELLDSEFALGDGTTVRWGDATKEQHQYRYDLHKRNAMAGLEGAARHQQAIDELESSGCETLREAVSVTA